MDELIKALTDTGLRFAHHAWSKAPESEYGVYAEEAGRDFVADGLHVERGTSGTVDYFTRDDSGKPRDTIEEALGGVCAWYLNSIQYEEDTGLIHYEWVWSVHG